MYENHAQDYRVKETSVAPTLGVHPTMNPTLVMENIPKAYSIDSLSSNSMKSSNPHSGFHETQKAKCLDTTVPDPSKNQGGVVVTYCLVGNTIGRQPQNGGMGKGVNEEVSFTLNTIDRHAVAQPMSAVGGRKYGLRARQVL